MGTKNTDYLELQRIASCSELNPAPNYAGLFHLIGYRARVAQELMSKDELYEKKKELFDYIEGQIKAILSLN